MKQNLDDILLDYLDKHRIKKGPFKSARSYGIRGAFEFTSPSCSNQTLYVISSGIPSEGSENFKSEWEHVSVSLKHRCPNWLEMCFVKDIFWNEDETVLQFHPKKSDYVNCCPTCLHLWKKSGANYELPPRELLGF